jgi:thioredoxin 1
MGRTVQLVQRITDSNFDAEVLASDVPVVIDFWAETCVPCRLQEPTINRLACELAGKAKVGRLDVYDNPRTTEAFNVRGVPHLTVIRNGEVVLEMVGGHSFDQLRARLRSTIDLP